MKGKMTTGHGSGTIVEFRLWRKELTLGENKREEEGEGGGVETEGGSFLARLQGQVLLSGVLRRPPAMPDLCSCRASLSASPC